MQTEYIQLCKTLYTLLHDSPDEHDLFQAMGRVVAMLLHTGEQNVRSPNSILEERSTARLQDGSSGAAEMKGPSMVKNEDELKLSGSCRNIAPEVTVDSETENVPSKCEQQQSVSPKEGSLSSFKSSSQTEESKKSENKLSVNTDEDDITVTGLKQVENLQLNLSSPGPVEITSQKSRTLEKDQHVPICSKSDDVLEPLILGVENDHELQEKWYLTFEQFVSALQQEPELCQFFAEQNTIDLAGSSVDPLLSHYTRTVLASSP